MRILQICPRSPVPPIDGGSQGMYHIAQGMRAAGHDVSTLAVGSVKDYKSALPYLNDFPLSFVRPVAHWRFVMRAAFTGLPISVSKYSTGRVVKRILSHLNEHPVDLLWFDHAHLALAAKLIKDLKGVPAVVRAHNLEWKIWERNAANTQNPFKKAFLLEEARRFKLFEKRIGNFVDAIISISELERDWFRRENPNSITLLMPAGFSGSIRPLSPLPKEPRILHLAPLDWVPNAEGLAWFLQDILPLIHQQKAETIVDIVGKNPPNSLVQRHSRDKRIRFHGFIENLESVEAAASCIIVPLKAGGGVRIKILNALARGIPVISTSVGCEGIPVTNGQEILLADEPGLFASQVMKALDGGPEINDMRHGGQEKVRKDYSWDSLVNQCLNEFIKLYGLKI